MVNEPGAPGVALVVVAALVKVAFTVLATYMLTVVEVDVPVAPPDHPAKIEPEAGVAVSVTLVPDVKLALHAVPQEIPPELLATVPVPVPALVTVSAYVVAALMPELTRLAMIEMAINFAFMISS